MIDVHIGELVLEGFPRGDRYRIAEAAELELRRLIEVYGLDHPVRTALPAPSIRLREPERAAAAGTRIGQSIFQSLGGKMP